MRCYPEGELLAYLDGEAPPARQAGMAAHLAGCHRCRQALDRLAREREAAGRALAPYRQAFLAGTRPRSEPRPPAWVKKGARRSMNQRTRGLAAAAAVAVLAGSLLAFPQARGLAGQFLSIFRINTLQVVEVNQQDLQDLARALRENMPADIESFGRVEATAVGEARSLSAAAALQQGLAVRLPQSLRGLPLRGEVEVTPGQQVTIVPRVAEINRYLQALGSTVLLPAELNGKAFAVSVPAVLLARYGEPGREVVLAQAAAPAVSVPEGVDVSRVRAALLAIPALPPALRQALGEVEDWQRTLLVPDVGGSAREVRVNGAAGVYIAPPGQDGAAPHGRMAALVWPQGGHWLALSGEFNLEQALDLAVELR